MAREQGTIIYQPYPLIGHAQTEISTGRTWENDTISGALKTFSSDTPYWFHIVGKAGTIIEKLAIVWGSYAEENYIKVIILKRQFTSEADTWTTHMAEQELHAQLSSFSYQTDDLVFDPITLDEDWYYSLRITNINITNYIILQAIRVGSRIRYL